LLRIWRWSRVLDTLVAALTGVPLAIAIRQ
jgi:hypothetical protein